MIWSNIILSNISNFCKVSFKTLLKGTFMALLVQPSLCQAGAEEISCYIWLMNVCLCFLCIWSFDSWLILRKIVFLFFWVNPTVKWFENHRHSEKKLQVKLFFFFFRKYWRTKCKCCQQGKSCLIDLYNKDILCTM